MERTARSQTTIDKPAAIVMTIVAMTMTHPVFALSVTETSDFPGGWSFNSYARRLGVMDAGINTVSGALSGECSGLPYPGPGGAYRYDCNSVIGTDSQDSFIVEVGAGYRLDSIFVSTSNAAAPNGFGVNFTIRDISTSLASYPSLPLNSTSPNILLTSLGEGEYSISMWAGSATQTGSFSLDYSIELNVTSVPVPAAAWLFASGLLGLVGGAIRKTT